MRPIGAITNFDGKTHIKIWVRFSLYNGKIVTLKSDIGGVLQPKTNYNVWNPAYAGILDSSIASQVTQVEIKKLATSIGSYAFYGYSSYAFSKLTTVNDDGGTIQTIGSSAFYSCSKLTTASFPNVTSIGSYAFMRCSSLTTISFPNVTSISNGAFGYCSKITTASFPNATSIGANAFLQCSSLTIASFPNATSIGGCFGGCVNLNSVYVENSTLHSIDNGYGQDRQIITDINNETLYAAVGGILKVYNSTVISIGSYAFYSCSSLSTASFPNATSICSNAFHSCSSLTTVSFPNATSIGANAFEWCSNLTTASFPNATSIGSNAFYACSGLTAVSFPNATSIGLYAFRFCFILTTASFPNVTSIGSSAFETCSRLTTISFPNASSIGEDAFWRCSKLTSIYFIGSSIPTLANSNAFSNIATSYSIYVAESLYSQYIVANQWSMLSSHITSYIS